MTKMNLCCARMKSEYSKGRIGINQYSHKLFYIGKGTPHGFLHKCPYCGKEL